MDVKAGLWFGNLGRFREQIYSLYNLPDN